MNKQEYLDLRNGLYTEAENLINEAKLEEGQAKMQEITDLDNKFENEGKALANLNALKDNSRITNLAVLSNNNAKGTVIDTFGAENNEDLSNTMEYRKAFMNYVTKGTAISGEFKNAAGPTKTSDVGEMIPETVLSRIIEKMEATGMILPLVTRTSYKGGLTIPTSTVKPTATWVAEGVTSENQKKSTGSITFAYHKLRCAISNSLEVDTMALPIFETTFVNNVVEAMTKALEKSIINGTGTGQPKGILSETVVEGQNIDVAKAAKLDYSVLVSAEAALPLAYENGAVWFMTKKTFMSFIGMVDTNGQPITRVNYGLNGQAERSLLGRKVILNDYMTSYDPTGATTHIFAFLFNPTDYVLNSNLNMTIKRYEDNETDDMVTKALMLVDGKVVDVNSLVTVTKKNA
ncbi:phage major capsid protein [Clostridium chromiireducens]|uniref:Phage major capsid protein n=1 Tax=Clostridium chromiireducens TaxID=225345 RepID=A0A964W0C3_9CLOT|nr:phage major capsid protein [Clostridium chromiireducens]MVX62244.1 phage major capsid protein [Clostridium chromiireducens]